MHALEESTLALLSICSCTFLLFAPTEYMYLSKVNLWYPPNFLEPTSPTTCLLITATPSTVLEVTRALANVRFNRLLGVIRGRPGYP